MVAWDRALNTAMSQDTAMSRYKLLMSPATLYFDLKKKLLLDIVVSLLGPMTSLKKAI